MVLEGIAGYIGLVKNSVDYIVREVEKICPPGQENGLNLNLMEKEDYLSSLILEIRGYIEKYIDKYAKNATFSPKESAEINMKISELLENLEREVEKKIENLKNARKRSKNIERMLKEMELEHYKNIFCYK